MKKLASAAITLPVEPWPAMRTSRCGVEWTRGLSRSEGLYCPAYVPPVPSQTSPAPVTRETAGASTPPMLKHWREVKAQRPDAILFYRVGDFYEMFYEDAELAARVLGITLTSRGDGVPLAGVPVKAAAEYLRQLVARGASGRHLRAGRGPTARQGTRAARGGGDRDARARSWPTAGSPAGATTG